MKAKIKSGLVYAPYISVETTDDPSDEYTKFIEEYNKLHECCPKCGESSNYTVTLMGYIFNSEKPKEYKDLNRCVCMTCGNKHFVHDRVLKKQ